MTRDRYYNGPPSETVSHQLPVSAAKIEFARRLSDALADKNWKQVDLARACGVGRDAISIYIAGKSLPNPSRLKQLADALGVDPSDLLPTRGVRSAATQAPAIDARDLGNGSVFLRVNQAVDWPIALKIMNLLQGE